MKKKILSILFITCFVIFSFFGLTACDSGNKNNENSPQELSAPVVSLTNNTASWEADTNADKFEISLDGNLSYVENTITSKTLTSGQTLKVRAVGDGVNYKTSAWSNSVTYTVSDPQNPSNPSVLNTPVVSISNTGLASWNAISNASGYKYKINNGNEQQTNSTSVQLSNGDSIVVKAIGDGVNYTDSNYSISKTYTAQSTQVQEPQYLGIFASNNEPNQGDGLPDDLDPQPVYGSSMGNPRSFGELLEEYFENSNNYFGTTYPTESNYDIYSRIGNQVYIQIWLNNPKQHTILSLKLNGTKYQVGGGLSSFFIEKSGVHYNCVYVAVTIPNETYGSKDYVVSEIEYIEGTYINADGENTFMNENNTISVGLPYNAQNPQISNFNEVSLTVNSYSSTFTFTDAQNLASLSGGWVGIAVYNEYKLFANQKITNGNNSLNVNGLIENSLYYVVAYVYADLHDGYGVRQHNIFNRHFFTPEVITVNEIDSSIILNSKGTGYIGAVNVDTTLSSNTAEYVKLEIIDSEDIVIYTDTEFTGNAVVTEGILNGANYTVRVYYKDTEYPEGKYIEEWVFVQKLKDPSIENDDYYTFVSNAIYSFEFSSYENNFAAVDSFIIRFYDDNSASYIAEEVLYLIDNPTAADDYMAQWYDLRNQLSNYETYSDAWYEISNQMNFVYNKHITLSRVHSDWQSNFDGNTDKSFWQAEAAKGKYICSYSYAGTDTENIIYSNGKYYLTLENINSNKLNKFDIVAQLVKNESTENNGLVEKIYTENLSNFGTETVFTERNYGCTEILEGYTLEENEFTFTLHNNHDRRIENYDETSSDCKKQYVYRISVNGHEVYKYETIKTLEIDEDSWIQEYMVNAKAGTLNAAELYKKYMLKYSEESLTLDFTEVDAGKYTFLILTRMYNKDYPDGEYEDYIDVYNMEIFKQLETPSLTFEGIYGYVTLPNGANKENIIVEAYDKNDNPITIENYNISWDYNTSSYRFEFAYVDAKARIMLTKNPNYGEDAGSNTETIYWLDSDWTEYIDSDAIYLPSPSVTAEEYSRRVNFTFTNSDLQDYFEKFVYTVNDGEERQGNSINFNQYGPGTYSIKVKAVVNYQGKETGYCDSEWITYSYTYQASGGKG